MRSPEDVGVGTPRPVGPSFRLRSLMLPVYLPTLLFALGQGVVIPYMALFATRELGATAAAAGVIFALRGIGTMVFDVPAGMLVSRFGERRAVIVSSLWLALASFGAAQSTSILMYAVLIFLLGNSWAVWLLARLTYVSEHVPAEHRGRAIALMAGTNRIGNFAGPFLGGFAAVALGIGVTFYIQATLVLVAAVALLLFVRDSARPAFEHGESTLGRVAAVVRDHRQILLTAGLAAIAIHVLRTSRQVVIPLWGDVLGLDEAQIGIIFGIGTSIDMFAFYPIGLMMDRFGRKWLAVACLLTMAAGMALIPATAGFTSLLVVGLLIGLGNGFGTGVVQTMGADFSPPGARSEFLGVWRLVSDVGTAMGPLLVAGVTAAATLGAASVASGGIGLIGALIMILLVPEPMRYRAARGSPPGPAGR